MIEKLEEWQKAFPEMFPDDCMFDLPSKWSDLVFDLCNDIETVILENSLPNDYIQVTEVTEKNGSLKFYTHTNHAPMISDIRALIQAAEKESRDEVR